MIELIVLFGYGSLAGRMTGLATRPRFAKLADRVAGSLLIAGGRGDGRDSPGLIAAP